jgi:hypothetical protein
MIVDAAVAIAPSSEKEWMKMQRESLYVVSDLGRERFVWAMSAREARAKAAADRRAETGHGALGQTLILGTTPTRSAEQRLRHEASAHP